jgi:TPR repeat protein
MKTCWTLFLLMFGIFAASARLGETADEIHARYGASLGGDIFLGLPAETFAFQEFTVLVVYKDGRSFLEALKPQANSTRIEAAQAELLASRIANCGTWSKSDTLNPPGIEWRGTNGAVAALNHGPNPPDSLVLYSSEAARMIKKPSATEVAVKAGDPSATNAPSTDQAADALRKQRQQAINGDVAAQYALGERYLAGDGVPMDILLARYWLEKAAAKNSVKAKAALKSLDPR